MPSAVLPSPLLQLLASPRVRFLLVGGFNTVFGYALFVALQETLGETLHYLGVLLVAHVISTLVAFAGYRYIVFRVRGNVLVDLLRFWSLYAAVLAVNAVALPALVELGGVPVILAQGVFLVLTIIVSYVGHGRFSFRRPTAEGTR
jgi:putative flippase GtrA